MPILLLLDISGNIEWKCLEISVFIDKERHSFNWLDDCFWIRLAQYATADWLKVILGGSHWLDQVSLVDTLECGSDSKGLRNFYS